MPLSSWSRSPRTALQTYEKSVNRVDPGQFLVAFQNTWTFCITQRRLQTSQSNLLCKLYFQRSSAHTFDALYCVKSATLHVSAFPRPSSGVPFYNIENISSHNVARCTSIKMETINYKFKITSF